MWTGFSATSIPVLMPRSPCLCVFAWLIVPAVLSLALFCKSFVPLFYSMFGKVNSLHEIPILL